MRLLGKPEKLGFSDFDGKPVEIFYGQEGPGLLYQREHFLPGRDPKPGALHADDGGLDFWFLR
jgi:hypothetical protein